MPVAARYLPAGHGEHAAAPVAAWNWPTGHPLRSLAPAAEKVSAAHGTKKPALGALQKKPVGHAAHCAAPVTLPNVLNAQPAQLDAPVEGWAVPTPHAVQPLAPTATKAPALQLAQLAPPSAGW